MSTPEKMTLREFTIRYQALGRSHQDAKITMMPPSTIDVVPLTIATDSQILLNERQNDGSDLVRCIERAMRMSANDLRENH